MATDADLVGEKQLFLKNISYVNEGKTQFLQIRQDEKNMLAKTWKGIVKVHMYTRTLARSWMYNGWPHPPPPGCLSTNWMVPWGQVWRMIIF